jgi:uncharacterized membrane protein YgcG
MPPAAAEPPTDALTLPATLAVTTKVTAVEVNAEAVSAASLASWTEKQMVHDAGGGRAIRAAEVELTLKASDGGSGGGEGGGGSGGHTGSGMDGGGREGGEDGATHTHVR